MEGLLTFLLFAGFFYLMMRFGCGAHMVHGHGSHKKNPGHPQSDRHIDPVCGIKVEVDKGYGKMHDGMLYRFCTRNCLDKFEADSEQYVVKALQPKQGAQ